MRWPLIRTRPDVASPAASARVRTIRACHSHLSTRWRSPSRRASDPQTPCGSAPFLGIGFELRLEGSKLGEGRIGIGGLVAAVLVGGAVAAGKGRAAARFAGFPGFARRPIGPRLAAGPGRPGRAL